MARSAVVITGVSTGIGLGCARAFCKAGYRVFGSVRKASDGERLARDLGASFTPLVFDVTDDDAVEAAATAVQKELAGDGLAGLVNNAGIATSGPLLMQSLDELRQQLEVNVVGQLRVTRAFMPLLEARSGESAGGRVIMVSSVSAKTSMPFLGAYSASKRALEGMTDALRRELMLFGVDVIIVRPGKVASAIWDKDSAQDITGVIGTPYEAAARAAQKVIVGSGQRGESIDVFGDRVLAVFRARRPRTLYTLVRDRVQEWVLPRSMPPRALDRLIGSRLGLRR